MEQGRVSQLLYLSFEVPYPMSRREFIIDAVAFDDINDQGEITIMLDAIDDDDDAIIPDKEDPSDVRVKFHGGFLFHKHEDPNLVKGSFYITYESRYLPLPNSFTQYLIRLTTSIYWKHFLSIAANVRDGKKPEYTQLIKEKGPELYDWVNERVALL